MEHFEPHLVIEPPKVECLFALVAQHLKNSRATLLGQTQLVAVDLNNVHLQGFYLKALFVSATRAGQPHRS